MAPPPWAAASMGWTAGSAAGALALGAGAAAPLRRRSGSSESPVRRGVRRLGGGGTGPRRRCRATAQAAVEILVIIDLALLDTLHFVAQLFDHATQIADLLLHDLQLVVDIARRAALLGLGPQWQTEHQCQGNTHHVAHRIILAERPVSTKTKSQAQNTAPGFG